MASPSIRTEDLSRVYKLGRREKKRRGPDAPQELVALAGVNVEVQPGELFGLLGPNGAGKTTLIKILTTLLAPSAGRAWVAGHDVAADPHAVRPLINMVSGGESCGYGLLTVRETLWLFTQLYGIATKEALERIDAMLAAVEMTDRAHTKVNQLSTGLRQKMNFCRGFVTNPQILFLDEPTLGLDVNAARTIRQFIREWVGEQPGRTILLTTHYMMEADQLCDRIAIIDKGKVLACDTPAALKKMAQRHALFEITVEPNGQTWEDVRQVQGVHSCTVHAGPTSVDLKFALEEEAAVGGVVQQIVTSGSRILTLKKIEPTLEDAFIELVGHGLEGNGA
jgi:ABC-2 type transport system ATP-binding protein